MKPSVDASGFFRPSPTPVGGRFVIDRTADTARCSVGLGYDLDELRPVVLYLPARWGEEARRQVERWAAIRHANVLPCFGWVEIEGRDVLAAERPAADWGRPLPLGERIRHAPATAAQAVNWALDISRGLLALAEVGLTHGGLCSQTVLIVEGGRACLTLPGVSASVLEDGGQDIHAVGALLRLLLTGRPDDDAPLSAEVGDIIDRCQTDDPARRFVGPAQLVEALARLCPPGQTDDPASWRHAARGSVLTHLRRYQQAAAEFAAAGPLARAFVNRATQHLILDRPDLAVRDACEALRLAPDDAEAHACLGQGLGEMEPTEGLTAFARAIELDPTAGRAHAGRAVLRARLGDRDGAAEDIAQAHRLAPEDPAVGALAAQVCELAGLAEEAVRLYRLALAVEPSCARVRTRLARLLEQAGKVSEAELEYSQALRDDPACAAAWQERGALRQRQGRGLEALADCTTALELRPWDPRPALARAALNRQLDQLDQAEADYAEVLHRDPDSLEAHLQWGELLLQRQQFRQALRHFDAVLAREANHPVAQRLRTETLAGLTRPAPAPVSVASSSSQGATGAAEHQAAVVRAAQAFFRGDYAGCVAHAFPCLADGVPLAPALFVLQSLQRLGRVQKLGLTERLEQTVTWALRRYQDRPFETAMIRLTLGDISASDALRQVGSNVQVCQACYCAGIRAGFEADLDRARRWLLEAAAVSEDCPERQFAEVALGLNAPEEIGSPATAELLVPFVLTGDADAVGAAVAAFVRHDFVETVAQVEQMDLLSAWKKDPRAIRFTPELSRAAIQLADQSRGVVPLEMTLVVGRLAAVSLGWLARPEDQARLAVRILARIPDRPFDRYLLHLALGTAEVERPLCPLRGPKDEGLCHFYAAQGCPPRAGDERAGRKREFLLESARRLAPAKSVERLLAEQELEGGPPPDTPLIIPDDMPPPYHVAEPQPGALALLMAQINCKRVEEACGRKSLAYSISLNNLAHEYDEAGDYPQAESHYLEALDTIRQTIPASENEARCLSNLAMLYRRWGRHLDAVRSHRLALDVQRRVRPVSPQDIGRTLNNLGVALANLGDPAGAEVVLRQSLQLRRTYETLDLFAQTLHNLADALLDLGKIGEARQLLLKTAEIRKRTLSPRHPELANLYTTLATVSQFMEQHDEAVHHAREALAIDDETIGPDHPQYAPTLSCLATAYRGAGDLAAAEEYFRRAIETWRRSSRRTAGFGTDQLLELALLLEAKGDLEGCWQTLAEVVEQEASDWLPSLMSGDSRQRLAVMKRVFVSLGYQLSILVRTFPDRQPEQTYARVLRRKGMVGESIRSQREAVRAAGDSERTEQLRKLALLRGRLASLSVARPDELTPQQWASRFAWEQQAADLERELTDVGEAATRRLASVGPADLLPALGEAALVEYVHFLEVDSKGAIRGQRYQAFVLDPGPPWTVRLVSLVEGQAIDSLVARFRQALADKSLSLKQLRELGEPLRAAVFDPVRPLLGQRRRVVLALDGELNRLPFAALPAAERGWLLDTYEFSHVSCGRDLLRPPPAPAEQREAVIFAGPTFDLNVPLGPGTGTPHPSADLERVLFGELESAAQEGDEVAKLLNPHFTTHVWTGRDAVKGRLTGLERAPHVLHLATHGFFLEEAGPRSGDAPTLSRGADPLTRGGIALAGAETWRRGGQLPVEMGNGLLLAAEVAELDLSGTELVLLSACEAALGEQRQGEGVFGLQRGFALAGARSLLMTLWKVDRPTRALVGRFYTELLGGESRSAALRKAQLWLRQRHPHPRDWGAFLLSGDAGPLHGLSPVP
jgi:tetratricopeptide (TPR) repeat protein